MKKSTPPPVEKKTDETPALIEWRAPMRVYKKRQSQYFRSILLVALAVEIILFFFTQYMLMLLVVSIVFVTFAINSTPPHEFFYKITKGGVMLEDQFFIWDELYDFYFKTKHGVDVLHIGTKAIIPGELIMPLNGVSKEKVKNILTDYLPFREYVKPTSLEKASDWLSKTFPLEERS